MRLAPILACSLAIGCCFGVPPAPPPPIASAPPAPVPAPAPAPMPAPAPAPAPALPGADLEGHLSDAAWERLAEELAPQAPGAPALFDAARAPRGAPLERTVLACRARVHGGGFDDSVLAGGADVALAARLGDRSIRSTAQTPARVYTFPVGRLDRGDPIWIRVIDRDVFFDDTIAEGSSAFAQAPFTLAMGQADVECRALDPALVARRADEAIARVARAIDGLEVGEPDPTAWDLGYPRARTTIVLDDARRAAAWVELSDPALAAQIDRARAFEDAWSERAEAAVAAAREGAPAVGEPIELGRGRRITVSAIECGRAARALLEEAGALPGTCAIRVVVEPGADPLRLAAMDAPTVVVDPLEAWGVDARGRMVPLPVVGRRDASGPVPAAEARTITEGSTIELVLAARYAGAPVLLRARHAPGRAVLARLE